MKLSNLTLSVLSACAFLSATSAMAADPAKIDWSKIPTTKLGLFFPGQTSYEWLRSAAHEGAGSACSFQAACGLAHRAAPLDPGDDSGISGESALAIFRTRARVGNFRAGARWLG